MKDKSSVGFLCVIFGVLSMASMPFLELVPVTGADITLARGIPGVIVLGAVWLLSKGVISLPNRSTAFLSLFFALATVGLFEGIKTWGANYTIIMLDMAVLVPLILKKFRGEKIPRAILIAFFVAIIGGVLSLRVWRIEDLVLSGFAWGMMALVFNGLYMEAGGKEQSTRQNIHTEVFWQSVGLSITGLLIGGGIVTALTFGQAAILILISVAAGLINFYLFLTSLKKLGNVLVGMLVLSITPLTIITSYIFLGKTMSLDQLVGVILSLTAVGYIALSGARKK